jgi:hypothetical protein
MAATKDRGSRTDGMRHCSAQTSGAQAQAPRVQVPRARTPAGDHEAALSRSGLEAGTPQDGWRYPTNLELSSFPSRMRIPGTLMDINKNFSEEKNPPEPHTIP